MPDQNGQNDASVLFGTTSTTQTPASNAGVSFAPTSSKNSDTSDTDVLFGSPAKSVQKMDASASTLFGSKQASSSDSNILFGTASEKLGEPEPQQTIESKGEASTQNDPWYKKAWDAVNEPLFDEGTMKNWFGTDVHSWGGLGQGIFGLLSGLTSPLQLALTIGTFGSSTLLDAGGVAALKVAGWGAKEIESVVSASSLASKAIKAGHNVDKVWQAMAASGFDVQKITEGLDVIKNAGLTPESLIATGVIRRAGSSALRQAGMGIGMAENIGQWTQTAIDAGFTVQNAYAAAITSPRVFDAIKEGDYETAKKLAVEAAGMGLFAGLGAHQAATHAGELMPDAAAKMGLRVKPSEENLKLIKEFESFDRENIINSESQKQWEKDMRSRHGDLKFDDMQRARFFYESGSSTNDLSKWYNAISEASGRDTRKPVTEPIPEKPVLALPPGKQQEYVPMNTAESTEGKLFYHGTRDSGFKDISKANPLGTDGGANLFGPGFYMTDNPTLAQGYGQKGNLLAGRLGKLNLIDMSSKADGSFIEAFRKSMPGEEYNAVLENLGRAPGTATKEQMYMALRDVYKYDMRSVDDYFETTSNVADNLHRAGFDGFRYEGGKRVGKGDILHNALVIFADYEKGKDLGDKVNFSAKEPITVKELHDIHNRLDAALKEANPNDPSVKRDTKLLDLINKAKLKEKPAEYIDRLLDQLDPDKLTDQHKEFSKEVSDRFSKTLEKAKAAGVLGEGFKNYMTRVFKDPENESVRKYKSTADSSGFSTYTSMARKRTFDTTLEGLLNGHELAELDPIALSAHNGNEFGRVINARNALDGLRGQGIRASDGRPMVALSGSGHAMIDEEGNRIGTAVQPGRAQSLRITNKVVEGLRKNIVKKGEAGKSDITELDRLLKQGQVTKFGVDKKTGEQLYAWTTHDYRDVDNPSFKGWASRVQDSEGNPIFIESDLKAHPEAHEYLNRRFGTKESIVSKIPGMKTFLKLGQEAKGILLFGSPFHIMQEGLRAVMTGISPFGHVEFDANSPIHRLAAEKGVWEGKEYKGATAFQEGLAGHSKLLSKIPGLAQIQDWQQKFLFDRYIPSLKLRAFENLNERYAKAYPDWTADKVANIAAADTANRFGGIPYKRMGRAAGTMDAARIMALAPDWLESEVRFMGSMFGEGGKITRRDTAKMALALWGVSRVLNAVMNNGNMHNEAPFGVALKDDDGREKIYSVRTLPTDMLHAASDPEGFLRGRVSPLVRTGIQTYTGRDEFGRKLPEHGVWINALRNISPIAVQAGVKKMTGEDPGISNADSFVKAGGFTVFPYRTEAQKLAAKIASDHSTGGQVDPDKLRRHSAVLNLEDKIRAGQAPLTTVHELVEQGQLHIDEAKAIEKNVKETAGMDPDLARLYMHASRAPMKDFLEIYDSATNQEKNTLVKLLISKKQAYIKKAIKTMSQAERQSDPVYLKIRALFPQDSPY